ncbi:MAG: hypothetical protein ACTSW7_01705 [Candidatus Thorarchaeota archaeon]
MGTEKGTINILLSQLTQSKAIVLFLVVLVISYFGRMTITWSWIFEHLIYGSIYFTFYLFSIALTTAMHERRHIVKLKELGFEATAFRVHRIGNMSFRIDNMDQMSADDVYQNAVSPFLTPTSYGSELICFLILVVLNIITPFPLDLVLFAFTLLALVHLVGSFCALSIIHKRKTSGLCVKLARTITSRGDIDEIVSWNKKR